MFFPMESARDLRHTLHAMIARAPVNAGFQEKWGFYRQVSATLAARAGQIVYGVWDYVEESARAQAEYDQWCKGTEDDVEDAEEAAKQVPVYRQSGGPRFLFVTFLFLMRRGGASDRYICEVCRIPEDFWWTRNTFARMLQSIGGLNFESIRADAVYLRPGHDDGGVTQQELAEPRYRYLKMLR